MGRFLGRHARRRVDEDVLVGRVGLGFGLLFRPPDGLVDALASLLADLLKRPLVDAPISEISGEALDRVPVLCGLAVLVGPVALGIAHEVAHPSVDLYLQQRRAVAVPRTSDRLPHGVVDRHGVVALDADARHVEPARPAGTVGDVGHAVLGHADRPVVVLDHEDDRQVVNRREVERFEKGP
ncbi:hypothetical protein HAPAU_06880 [Halalkalicoccus paucihalophilus]|uniref:Uncharacterized protein n=1 Tax=Halalkalicoccus paucihalophilus TaxID=1008153 RepID=A0A151AHT2_9EURY|nr:hypothetical protein HAPAU_06880 [Halalkalicoccus paucihalophilus]